MHTAWGREFCGLLRVIGCIRHIFRRRMFQVPVVNGGITTMGEITVLLSALRDRHLAEFGERLHLVSYFIFDIF